MATDNEKYLLNIDEILGEKLSKKLPGFVKSFLKRRLHLKQINDCILKAQYPSGIGFFDEALDYVGITYRVRGLEKIDTSRKYIYAGNHPLGGPEALIIGSIFRQIYNDGFRVPVNSILGKMKSLAEFFTPVNVVSSKQNRNLGEQIDRMLRSDHQILIFPAGKCARKYHGKVTELPWKKSVISMSRKYQRDIIPVHTSGYNSGKFMFFSRLSEILRLKVNIGMLFLVDELFNKKGTEFVITFGDPIPWETFDRSKSDLQWAEFVKNKVAEIAIGNGKEPNM